MRLVRHPDQLRRIRLGALRDNPGGRLRRRASRSSGKSAGLTEKIRDLIDENEDFAVQLVEDKASNGYLQIITAQALGDPAIMRRFVSDDVFNKIPMPEAGARVAYNRIYLNDVYLVGVAEEEDRNVLAIAIKSSFQRVKLKDGKAAKLRSRP